ncbi:tetratricopeptide repeat-containing sulfotransferase family protein [uncultured Jannaschia sp.]|uniref:tetratricopeptide repeat-containing sulfotransferase family protein n=1 Tax=uncultured Jannaschia sp. TaxID=293347 RepID=UPI00260D9A8D|nr:tetratricopeptide repeat-containing sulfotransferase family protein [uncultured Jannaschia sp.]
MTAPSSDLQTARRMLDHGQAAPARDRLLRLLEGDAAAEAWLLLARAEADLGAAEAARTAFARCLALAPSEPVAWMELAIFEAAQGRGGDVVKRARQAALPSVLLTMLRDAAGGTGARALGTGAATKADLATLSRAAETGDTHAAERKARPLLLKGGGAVLWGLLGQARTRAGQPDGAVEAYDQGLRLEPYAVDLRLALVQARLASGAVPAALLDARFAARAAPGLARAQILFGRTALRAGQSDLALEIAEAALARGLRDDGLLALAAEAAMEARQGDLAVERAAARHREAPGRDLLLAATQDRAGRVEAALDTYGAILAREPANRDALTARGQLLQTLGRAGAAEADLRAAVAADPLDGTAFRALAYARRLDPGDEALRAAMAARARPDLPGAAARTLDYGLARALAPHDPEAAARHLAQANAAMLAAYPHDPRQPAAQVARAREVIWPALRTAMASGAESACDAAPIFVTGLPRSGTTLVEAILAAHPEVVAGGELAVLRRAATPLHDAIAGNAPVTSDLLTGTGAAYVAAADRAAGGSTDRRRTDKSIFSFLEIGTIRAALPQARIVVVTRDPRDTGLSIWRNHFREGTHRYAASQEGIADQIAAFHNAIAFWRDALPDAFHTLRYEALLDDPEKEARALLAACDLPWDPAVLSFHEAASPVATLSFAQVRRPIYTSSRGGWRDSAAEIAPLIASLTRKGLLPDE